MSDWSQCSSSPSAAETSFAKADASPARGAAPVRTDWDSALTLAAERFNTVIHSHGPDAVGFYISGQLLTEDYYVFNKLAKGFQSSVQATRERLGQVAPEEITELPQGASQMVAQCPGYKQLTAVPMNP